MTSSIDRWAAGDAYEAFMGRWSRQLGLRFLEWVAPEPGADWLDVGCGTGALTASICARAQPGSVVACDPSAAFVSFARKSIEDRSVTFLVASADGLPRRGGGFDVIVSGLVLNFLPRPAEAVRFMKERLRAGGRLAAYVWDYAEGMEFLRIFWEEAAALDPSAAQHDEGRRFPLCRLDALIQLFKSAGLISVEAEPLEIPTVFPDFEAFWSPFLGGTGPGPAYVGSLDEDARLRLRSRLKQRLGSSADGPIHLTARALGVRGFAAE
jgi:SAM-dependent methyltransferase